MKKLNFGGGNSESLKNSHSHKSSPVRNFTDAHRKLRRKLKIDSKEFESRENLAGKWCVVSPIWGIWVEFEWLCSMRRKTLTLILSNFYHNFVFLPSFHLRCPLSSPAFQIAPLPGCISSYFSGMFFHSLECFSCHSSFFVLKFDQFCRFYLFHFVWIYFTKHVFYFFVDHGIGTK